MLRTALNLLLLLTLGSAAAQQPLTPPTYYLGLLERLEVGSSIRGQLNADSGQNFKDGSYLNLYRLDGQAGQFVTVSVQSSDFDSYVTVYGPGGVLVAANDDGDYYSYDAAVSFALPTTGTYLVVVSSYAAGEWGDYTVSATDLSLASRGAQVPGVTREELGAHLVPLPSLPDTFGQAYDFEVATDGLLLISVASLDFDTMVYLYDFAGNLIGQNDDRDFSEASGYNTDSQLLAELAAGSYTLYVSSWDSGARGEFTLSLRLLQEVR